MSRVNKTIIEVCFPLFKMVYELNNGNLASDFQLLQSTVLHEFFNIEEALKDMGMSDAICMDVKFVMSAFLDEMIVKRGDDCANAWSKESLQIQFFKENLGGEKFFERLSYLQRFSDKRFDILELYYWCLELGYEGKYYKDDSNDLKVMQENLRAVIKQHQSESYTAVDFQGAVCLETGNGVTFLRKTPLKMIVLSILLSGAVVYGLQILMVDHLLK